MTRDQVIEALVAVPVVAGGVDVRVGIYVGHGNFVTTDVVMVLWAADEDGESQVVLQIPTPEGFADVSLARDYDMMRVN
jgi:hypothetical protein